MSQVDRYTCEQVFQRLDDYLDRELSAEEMRQVRAHLDLCAGCAAMFRFQAEALSTLRARIQRLDVSASLREKVASALRRAQAEAGNG